MSESTPMWARWVAGAWTVALLLAVWPTSGLGAALLHGWLVTTGPPLAAAVSLLLAAWGFGAWSTPVLLARAPSDPGSRLVIDTAFGLVILQVGAVLGTIPGLLGWGVAVLGLGWIAAVARWVRHRPAPPVAPSAWTVVAATVAAGLLFPALFSVGAPPTGADELQYHVRMPLDLVQYGLATHPHDPVSAFPRGLHVLHGLGLGLHPDLGRPLALLFGLGGVLAGHRIAVRLGGTLAGGFALVALCGAASWLRMTPVISTDVPLALFLGAALLLLLDAIEDEAALDVRFALALGLLGGAAFSIKYTAAVYFAPVWMVAGVLALRARRFPVAAALVASAGLPILFAAPWMGANITAGVHALYPFKGIATDPAFRFNQTENYGAGGGLMAWLRTPWDLFVLGTEFDRRHYLGRLGMWPVFAIPGVLLAGRRKAVMAVFAVATLGFMLWAGPLRRVAYLLPLWPVIAALCGVGFAELTRGRGQWLPALVFSVAVVVAAAEVAPAWTAGLADSAVASGRADRNTTRDSRAESSAAWAWVRENTPPGSTVATAFVWEVIAPEHRVLWACAEECPTVRLTLAEAGSGAEVARVLRELGARWIVVKKQPFLRSGYPDMTDEQFALGYERPLQVLDELLSLHATEEHRSGLYGVYALDAPRQKAAPAP
ncbi:MAG: hypothetical protein KDA24_17715 [Deltaproteobacteria bacterium]|nr:hypothetical protein [Deltaproteobacteria bacterium]